MTIQDQSTALIEQLVAACKQLREIYADFLESDACPLCEVCEQLATEPRGDMPDYCVNCPWVVIEEAHEGLRYFPCQNNSLAVDIYDLRTGIGHPIRLSPRQEKARQKRIQQLDDWIAQYEAELARRSSSTNND